MRPNPCLMPAGYFGPFGGCYVPETLKTPLEALAAAYAEAQADASFQRNSTAICAHYVNRPSLLYRADRLTAHYGGADHLSETRRPLPYRLA